MWIYSTNPKYIPQMVSHPRPLVDSVQCLYQTESNSNSNSLGEKMNRDLGYGVELRCSSCNIWYDIFITYKGLSKINMAI